MAATIFCKNGPKYLKGQREPIFTEPLHAKKRDFIPDACYRYTYGCPLRVTMIRFAAMHMYQNTMAHKFDFILLKNFFSLHFHVRRILVLMLPSLFLVT